MRFLSVAKEELQSAARRKGTHRLRWVTASSFLLFLLWLAWASNFYRNRSVAPEIFTACTVILFGYCLFVGAASTADCISREKRDGTLGLLFLTNLKSAEIVLGKLISNGVAMMYSLVAVMPIMAMLILVGGVTLSSYCRTTLALSVTLFFAMSAGFFASAFCRRQFPAVALATALAILLGTAPFATAQIMSLLKYPRSLTDAISTLCPLHTILAAANNLRFIGLTDFWISVGEVTGISVFLLLLTAWRTKYVWRDRPKVSRSRGRFGFRLLPNGRFNTGGATMRARLLSINPLYWLAGRQKLSAPIFMVLIVLLIGITELIVIPRVERALPAFGAPPFIYHFIAWLWLGLIIHALVLYYAASAASQQLAEDRQNGALELILSTPVTEKKINRGLWLAYGRRMFFPFLAAVLVHFYFVWQLGMMIVFEPPGRVSLPAGMSPLELLWLGLLNEPIRGKYLDWQIPFMTRTAAAILVGLAANWVMVGFVGRWLGVRMKHPGFAPMLCLALAVIPPVFIISVICYVGDQMHLDRLPEQRLVPMVMWMCFGVVMANCVILASWAARKLHRDLRATVMGRFAPMRPWWRPSLRGALRFARTVVILVVLGALAFGSFYVYQNWQSRRGWTRFKKELAARGESLNLAASLPAPVADAENFAKSAAFRSWLNLNGTNQAAALRQRLAPYISNRNVNFNSYTPPGTGLPGIWIKQGVANFEEPLAYIVPRYRRGSIKDRNQAAEAILNGLKPVETNLAVVAAASKLPFFQISTNRTPPMVILHAVDTLSAMEQLHSLFSLRATALLELDRPAESAEDVLTSLRLMQLVRQSPDIVSSQRIRMLLGHTLQPVWEGLMAHRWDGSQLASFQRELSRFNLLEDYTNNVHLVALAYMETWQRIPDGGPAQFVEPGTVRMPQPHAAMRLEPRSWWYDNAIQLYQASREAISRMDSQTGRVDRDYQWIGVNSLPLDYAAQNLFQQYTWAGNNFHLVPFAQVALNQAVIACALERFRLAHGRYPSSLNELKPDYLEAIPIDVFTGRAMAYQASGTNSFDLRGVGPNGVNDRNKTAGGDDWVWPASVITNTNTSPTTIGTPLIQRQNQ